VSVSGCLRGGGGPHFQGCHGYLLSAVSIWHPLTSKAPAPKLIISDKFIKLGKKNSLSSRSIIRQNQPPAWHHIEEPDSFEMRISKQEALLKGIEGSAEIVLYVLHLQSFFPTDP